MRQAQKMQENGRGAAACLQDHRGFCGGGGHGAVNGGQELVSIKIDPAVADPKDVDMLQDLVVAAVNEG
jgi:DNA-binding protein YbaB